MRPSNRPVDTIEFWNDRINSKDTLRYSIYEANEELWEYIVSCHSNIIKKHITEIDKVLDAACGYGRASEFIPGHYTGIDMQPFFISEARKRYPNKHFLEGNLHFLPFNNDTFDWAVCISVRMMMKDDLGIEYWHKAKNELLRVSQKLLCLEYEDEGLSCKEYKIYERPNN